MPPFKTTTPRAYKDEKAAAGLIDAEWMKDAEERLRNPHIDPREYGAVCDSTGAAGSGTDDTKALEEAIAAAIEQKRPLFIPGKMRITKGLKAVTDRFEVFGLDTLASRLVPDNSSFDALTIGPGAEGSGNKPSGYARDLGISGGNATVTKAGVGPDTGKAAFVLDGMRMFNIERVAISGSHDIGFYLKHNCFGSRLVLCETEEKSCRVGLNLPKGEESGEDLSFYDCWLKGEVAAVQIAASGKNYRFNGGQLSAGRQLTKDEDERGVLILNKDYLTGAVVTEGEVHVQMRTSFEFFPHVWAIRSFALVRLDLNSSFNPGGSEGKAIGFFKGSGLLNSTVTMNECNIHNAFSKPAAEMVVLEGTLTDFSWIENNSYGTYEDGTGSTFAIWNPMFVRAKLANSRGMASGEVIGLGHGLMLKSEGSAIKWSRDWGSTWKYLTPEGKTYASANTLTLDHGIALAKITGTTTIKKIEPTFEGHFVVLKFAASLTLAAENNLKIGASFGATENDCIALVCDGTNWYRVAAGAAN